MKSLFKMLSMILMALMAVSCQEEEPCPCGREMKLPLYGVSIYNPLPAEAGSEDVEIFCLHEAADREGVTINLMATSLPLLRKSQQEWALYENSGLIFVPERIYKEAGYENYPNDINFSYNYKWLTVATYKEAGSEYGTIRLSWEANDSPMSRKLYISIGSAEKCEFELVQSGRTTPE